MKYGTRCKTKVFYLSALWNIHHSNEHAVHTINQPISFYSTNKDSSTITYFAWGGGSAPFYKKYSAQFAINIFRIRKFQYSHNKALYMNWLLFLSQDKLEFDFTWKYNPLINKNNQQWIVSSQRNKRIIRTRSDLNMKGKYHTKSFLWFLEPFPDCIINRILHQLIINMKKISENSRIRTCRMQTVPTDS